MFELGPHSLGLILKDAMSADSLQNLSTLIGGGREGLVPIIVTREGHGF